MRGEGAGRPARFGLSSVGAWVRRRPFLAAFLVFLVLSPWIFAAEEAHIRFRFTLEIETPSGVVSGSSVIAQTIVDQPILGNSRSKIDGEATVVRLPDGRVLYALQASGARANSSSWSVGIVGDLFAQDARRIGIVGNTIGSYVIASRSVGEKREVAMRLLPTFVTFADPSDPMSFRSIDPSKQPLGDLLGPGYSIHRATIEILPAGTWPFSWWGPLLGFRSPEWAFGVPTTRQLRLMVPFADRGGPDACIVTRSDQMADDRNLCRKILMSFARTS